MSYDLCFLKKRSVLFGCVDSVVYVRELMLEFDGIEYFVFFLLK